MKHKPHQHLGEKPNEAEICETRLKMLFELHHRQLHETQDQIQSITEKATGIILLITGWIVLSNAVPPTRLKCVLTAGLILFSIAVSSFLITHAKGRKRVASVIDKLNEHMGLFSENRLIQQQSLYPAPWRGLGSRPIWRMVGAHVALVIEVAAIAIAAIWSK